MTELTRGFQEILEKFGEPRSATIPSADQINAYRGKLPQSLLDFWSFHGFGIMGNGYFQLCNPADFVGVIDIYFANDKDFDANKMHVFGMSAMGILHIWSEKFYTCKIDGPDSIFVSSYYNKPDYVPGPDWIIEDKIYMSDGEVYDPVSSDGSRLFKKALKKFGPLAPGEVYGCKLAPAIGGKYTLENLKKQHAVEHFGIMAQMEPLRFIDYSTMQPRLIRVIGQS
jgi:hypothetical protein